MVETPPRYRKLNPFLRHAFGEKVSRVGVWGGFTCPNRDGVKGTGGCIFCNPESSEPLNHAPGMTLAEQLERGIAYIRWRHGSRRFVIFFEDYTTTYADVDRLVGLYREALAHPGVVGLALSTRPDCLGPDTLDLLGRLARETFLWIELGVQSAHDVTLRAINRCHTVDDTRRAASGLRERGLIFSAHVILGLPGESVADMLATARFLVENGFHGVKIHNLHVVERTALAAMYHRGEYEPMTLETYVDLVIRVLEHLPPEMIAQRLTGEAPRRLTVAPEWSVNKLGVLNAIDRELERRDAWQGKALGWPRSALAAPIGLPGLTSESAPKKECRLRTPKPN